MNEGLRTTPTVPEARERARADIEIALRQLEGAGPISAEYAQRAREVFEALADEHERLRGALEYVEWCHDGEDDRCPACGMTEKQGHDWSCKLAAALAGPLTRETPGG